MGGPLAPCFLMCPFLPSEKALQEPPMEESTPKVRLPWGTPQ